MAVKVAKAGIRLPTEKHQPSDKIGDYTWLFYGERKIGKTSLAAQFEDALFLMFEPGGGGLNTYQVPVETWDEFLEIVSQLSEGGHEYKTIVIDTVDIAYERCVAYTGRSLGFEHPSDNNDYGKSWAAVSRQFQNGINKLVQLGFGVLFISHAKEREFTSEKGRSFNKWVPSMSNQAKTFVTGFVDVIAYYGYAGDTRYLTIKGSDMIDAGHRMAGRFRTKPDENGKSKDIYSIPMGDSAEEGYENILKAFNNEQEDQCRPKEDTAVGDSLARRLGKSK